MQFHQIINWRHLSNEIFRVWRLKLHVIPKLPDIANMQRSNSLILNHHIFIVVALFLISFRLQYNEFFYTWVILGISTMKKYKQGIHLQFFEWTVYLECNFDYTKYHTASNWIMLIWNQNQFSENCSEKLCRFKITQFNVLSLTTSVN